MNKEERKRLINANYGLNYNKLENSHICVGHLEKINFPENTVYCDTDSILHDSFVIETEKGYQWKNIIR